MRISTIDERNQRRLILEGKLIAPWVVELRTACEQARVDLGVRELVIEMNNLTAISQEGENLLMELVNQGIRFRCRGVFTKLILKQLARRARTKVEGQKNELRSETQDHETWWRSICDE